MNDKPFLCLSVRTTNMLIVHIEKWFYINKLPLVNLYQWYALGSKKGEAN